MAHATTGAAQWWGCHRPVGLGMPQALGRFASPKRHGMLSVTGQAACTQFVNWSTQPLGWPIGSAFAGSAVLLLAASCDADNFVHRN